MVTRELDPGRAVEITSPAYGTGYRIGGRLVLTAKHLVEGAADCRCAVRTESGPVTAQIVWTSATWDAALLEIDLPCTEVPPAALGCFEASKLASRVAFEMYGYPEWARTLLHGEKGVEVGVGARHIEGVIHLADSSHQDLLVLEPERYPERGTPDWSPWKGMSGAAVLSDGRVVAVLQQHLRPELAKSLEAVPVLAFSDQTFQQILTVRNVPSKLEVVRGSVTRTSNRENASYTPKPTVELQRESSRLTGIFAVLYFAFLTSLYFFGATAIVFWIGCGLSKSTTYDDYSEMSGIVVGVLLSVFVSLNLWSEGPHPGQTMALAFSIPDCVVDCSKHGLVSIWMKIVLSPILITVGVVMACLHGFVGFVLGSLLMAFLTYFPRTILTWLDVKASAPAWGFGGAGIASGVWFTLVLIIATIIAINPNRTTKQ